MFALNQETPGGLWLCPLALYSKIWKGRHAATYKLFIRVDVCFLSLPVQKKERTKRMFVWFWRHAMCGLVLCNNQYHNLNVLFLVVVLSCHPCFLLYYSISEWCMIYGLDICVQGGDVGVSTGRCFIFVMKYIMLTYSQAGIMFISFCWWMPVFNPLEKMQTCVEGAWWNRSGRKKAVSAC